MDQNVPDTQLNQPSPAVSNTSYQSAPSASTSVRGKGYLQSFKDNFLKRNTGKIVITFLLVFIVLYVLVYVWKMYMSSSLQTTTLLKKPISIPFSEVDITRDVTLPKNIVGNQYSISFWIYIDGVPPTTKDKFVLSRGPVEFTIDKTNALVADIGQKLTFDNFPTNRWVNVALVVDENLATLYVDGKFSVTKTGNFQAISGPVIIGKPDYRERVDGYLSKVQVYNYTITIDHAQIIYKAGPLHKSILGMIGIPMYGLRNPFVRLDEVKVSQ